MSTTEKREQKQAMPQALVEAIENFVASAPFTGIDYGSFSRCCFATEVKKISAQQELINQVNNFAKSIDDLLPLVQELITKNKKDINVIADSLWASIKTVIGTKKIPIEITRSDKSLVTDPALAALYLTHAFLLRATAREKDVLALGTVLKDWYVLNQKKIALTPDARQFYLDIEEILKNNPLPSMPFFLDTVRETRIMLQVCQMHLLDPQWQELIEPFITDYSKKECSQMEIVTLAKAMIDYIESVKKLAVPAKLASAAPAQSPMK